MKHIVTALIVMLSACSGRAPPPIAATVCDLPMHVGRTVQVDAEISPDRDGRTVIGDARCARTKIELRLSAGATRAGAAEQLMAASRSAASSHNASIPVKLTGIYTSESGDYFTADSVAVLPAPK
jgi:hypothetical protein